METSNWLEQAKDRLLKQEEKAENLRASSIEKVCEIVGKNLNSSQLYLLRYHFRQIEQAEDDLIRIGERYEKLP